MQTDELITLVNNALEELKAKEIVQIDVREQTSITDYMMIASGTSSRHVSALSDNVVEKAKLAGNKPLGVEGKAGGEWVLVDLGDVVVHIMQPATRQFYDLERLWESAESRRAAAQQPTE
ncbi:ribosome silencing factor [Halopseudomonas salegens]|uniref:Ribosomal silencing factor RsfS n=1 Tax=Halopseudomonas salegens TaxID=1434072 RepID=A0A1H2GH40_9GAMM|nr:ribosome silencing factor [Halopseudomonas salegens]SDU18728.1 ribosome-associated protein [Halopseudomonas salegens]